MRILIVQLIAAGALLATALPFAHAQAVPGDARGSEGGSALGAAAMPPAGTAAAPAARARTMRVSVRVERAGESAPVEGAAVELRAARPKGPFEPEDPKPARTWSAVSGADGLARFDEVPADLAKRGLRLTPVVRWDGMTFKGSASVPTDGMTMPVSVALRGFEVSSVRIRSVRFIVEPWEGYLVFSQLITLGVDGGRAIDTTLLPGAAYKEGLPIQLPIKAQGIRAFGGEGESKIIDSTVYWRGVLTPGSDISLQLRYSMAVRDPAFVYTQTYAYPVGALEVIVPVETRHTQKLAAHGGESASRRPGSRPRTFAPAPTARVCRRARSSSGGAARRSRQAPRSCSSSTTLPFRRSIAPWIALALGLLGAAGVFAFARRDQRRVREVRSPERLRSALEGERVDATRTLRAVEAAGASGELIEREYAVERARARTHLALVLRKIDELDAERDDADTGAAG